jgi:hypothetical protein
VERATLGLREAERVAEAERARVAEAERDLLATTAERDEARGVPLPSTFRAADLVQREAHLASIAARVAGHEARLVSDREVLEKAEALCAERRVSLARALAEERAVAVALDERARVRALSAERKADDEALEARAHDTRRA